MKKSTFIFIVALFLGITCAPKAIAANEYMQDKKLTVVKSNIALAELFTLIEQQSKFLFVYMDSDIKNIKVNANFKNKRINEILDVVLKNTELSYSINERNVNIFKKTKTVQPKNKKISGLVTDNDGSPIIGANILIKGTTKGTVTDQEGRFSIDLQLDDVLRVSYIGYQTQEVAVGNKSDLAVSLTDDIRTLDDVVVVGFGTQKKVNLTGAVESVSIKDMGKRLVGQTSVALQGLVPGVAITQRSGKPGADGAIISVRGKTTLGNNDVLVLVDGVEMNINDVDPSLIESMSVLKDAASASIYGSRAANGVILITTKRAQSDKFSVSYKGYMGRQSVIETPDKVGALDHMRLMDIAYKNVGLSPVFGDQKIKDYEAGMSTDPDKYPNTDWYKECLTNSGLMQNHFITLSGGSKRIRSIANFGYMSQEGIIENSGYDRYTFHVNSDMDIFKNLTAKVDAHLTYGKRKEPSNADVFNWMTRIPANENGILSNGKWGKGWNGNNPIAMTHDGGTINVASPNALLNFSLVYKPVDFLTVQASYSPNYYESHESTYLRSIYTYNPDGTLAYKSPEQSTLTESSARNLRQLLTTSATFDKKFGVHGITSMVGYQQDTYRYDVHWGSRLDFPFADFPVLDAGGIQGQQSGGTAKEWALQSVFGRVNYSVLDRYLFEANLRYDCSSRFASDNRGALFPSLSAGWRISEESFWSPVKEVINNFKVRGSWGQLGNQNIGDFYPFASRVSLDGIKYIFNDKGAAGAAITNMSNRNITWETTTVSDLGVDAMFFNKLNVTFDYYYKRTKDILLRLNVPLIIGMNAPQQNAGEVENRGWDFSLSYNDKIGDFSYRAAFNLSDVKNKILDLKGINETGLLVNREGEEMYSIYGLKAIGYIQPEDYDANKKYMYASQYGNFGPGDIKYEDVDKNGVINTADRQILGGTLPRYTFGLSLFCEYKGIDLSVLMQGVGKANGYLEGHGIQPFFEGGTAQEQHKDYWTPDNRNAKFPRLAFNQTNNIQYSSFWMKDAAYARLKNV